MSNPDIERINAMLGAVCDDHDSEWGHHVTCGKCGRRCCRWWLECERDPLPWCCPMCGGEQA
jgi:hypothetical protein